MKKSREEQRAFDLGRHQWFGIVHLDNIEEVADAARVLLSGSRFTAVTVHHVQGCIPTVEVFPSEELSSDGVELVEGGDYLGLRVSSRTHTWFFHTRYDGPLPGEPGLLFDPAFNRPYAKFRRSEGPSFRWSCRAGEGTDVVTHVFSVERDDRMDMVWDVMEA